MQVQGKTVSVSDMTPFRLSPPISVRREAPAYGSNRQDDGIVHRRVGDAS